MKSNAEHPLAITAITSTPGITRRHFVKRTGAATAATAFAFCLLRNEASADLIYSNGKVLLYKVITVENADIGKICGVDGDTKIPVFATNVTVIKREARYDEPPATEVGPNITGMTAIYDKNNKLVGYTITATTIRIEVATKP